ncbi:MAG: AI-2E family transporter [Proteobacteria bacterium]|nr:MAG: AI-2E family transporter [Pseudomonadota bacterium]
MSAAPLCAKPCSRILAGTYEREGAAMARELKVLNISVTFIAVVLAGYVLYAARDLFIPFAVALMVWYIISALTDLVGRLRVGGLVAPRWLALSVALIGMGLAIKLIVDLVSSNVNEVARAAPAYAANIERIAEVVRAWFDLPELPTFTDILKDINIGQWIGTLASALSNFAGKFGLVVVYVIFLLVAQGSFGKKIEALFPDPGRRARVLMMLGRMHRQIQSYVWIKTWVSALTGVVAYVVLAAVGLDFASFWAFVVFLLNYIPNIGSIIAVIFPSALALVQFGEPVPFLAVTLGLIATQFLIGNILEPRVTGSSLGLDPLVLLLALIAWGMMWGVVGMFLSVPLTVILMIVLAQFEGSRPIAIVMSKDGRLSED